MGKGEATYITSLGQPFPKPSTVALIAMRSLSRALKECSIVTFFSLIDENKWFEKR